jgi:hypothetical protein
VPSDVVNDEIVFARLGRHEMEVVERRFQIRICLWVLEHAPVLAFF